MFVFTKNASSRKPAAPAVVGLGLTIKVSLCHISLQAVTAESQQLVHRPVGADCDQHSCGRSFMRLRDHLRGAQPAWGDGVLAARTGTSPAVLSAQEVTSIITTSWCRGYTP